MYTQSNRSDGINTLNFATLYPVVGVDNCDLDSVAERRGLPLARLHLPLEIGEPVFRDLADGCLRASLLFGLALRLRTPRRGRHENSPSDVCARDRESGLRIHQSLISPEMISLPPRHRCSLYIFHVLCPSRSLEGISAR